MPNPKRRHSKARTGKRRAHDALRAPQTTLCPNCQEPRLPHRVCPKCGFYKGRDLLGGDMWGYGGLNYFHAAGTAKVRNIELPASWKHGAVPDTKHLLKSQAIIDEINNYVPRPDPELHIPANHETMKPETLHLAWAEDVWYSIKKHWVFELQRFIKAKRARLQAAGS